MKYPHNEVEAKWQKYWEENKIYKTDFSKPDEKVYSLVMFIYPSGAKTHCGHWYNYGPADTWARYRKMKGYNVFEPFGYDAFGLPAENYAIQTGIHPYDSTIKNIADIKGQLKRIGCMYDWDAELMTCDPEYYKWNQWLFLQLYKKGLAYRKNAPVNWCEKDQTVLANEQVKDGKCERCDNPVVQKNLTQWFFRITDYADELLAGLDTINWPEETKTKQRNWIGRSEGAEIEFPVEGSDKKIKVFTTRPDTLYGVTYVVLAPEHPLVKEITTDENLAAVNAYIDQTKFLTEIDRTSTTKEKTGVATGAYAVNPVNGARIPVWIADYALLTYGTGCVMAVPGHDERDFEFANKFGLPVKKVILQEGTSAGDPLTAAFTETGTMINSAQFDGMNSDDAVKAITEHIEKLGAGSKKINFRLRDWLISRQRYWGTPIPIVYCPDCGEVPVPEEQLPVELPYDVKFKPTGESPLKSHPSFMKAKCPKCGNENGHRDPDTMDTFVDSSWYYFRYLDPRYSENIFNTELAKTWIPVDMYIGGREHSTMHLLYARFIHKFLRDLGLTAADEPFRRLVHQGTITNQGAKMSKSKGNVVNPDSFVERFGSDVFRLYLMFMGPYEDGGDWSDQGIVGPERFVEKIYNLVVKYKGILNTAPAPGKLDPAALNPEEKAVYRKINQVIEQYDRDLENLGFNTSIAALMDLSNEISRTFDKCSDSVKSYVLIRLAVLLAPLAPHFGEECAEIIGVKESLFKSPVWFTPDPAALVKESVNYAVQVNGKLRATIEMPVSAGKDELVAAAMADIRVSKFVEGFTVVKEIFVPGKILNIVVK